MENNNTRRPAHVGRTILIAVLAVVILVLLLSSLYVVQPNEYGVVRQFGAGADLADGCGECVPPGDASALCDALHRLMTDGMYRRACGENARRRAVTEFDLTRQTEELLALYQKG